MRPLETEMRGLGSKPRLSLQRDSEPGWLRLDDQLADLDFEEGLHEIHCPLVDGLDDDDFDDAGGGRASQDHLALAHRDREQEERELIFGADSSTIRPLTHVPLIGHDDDDVGGSGCCGGGGGGSGDDAGGSGGGGGSGSSAPNRTPPFPPLLVLISGSEVNTNQEYIQIPLAVVSDDDTIQRVTAYYFVQAQKAYLRGEISRIDTKISADKSRTFEFKIYNDGMGESGDIGVNVPEASWMQLRSQKILPSMSAGDTSIVILEFIPSAELSLNTPATGTIRVIATNGNSISIPYTLEKVSNKKGGVVVDVIDNYTYFTEEAPHVANAKVKISHYFTGEVFAEGVTDADGLFSVDSLPEGNLRLVVQADKHQGYDGLVNVSPGDVVTEVVFLKYQAISFTWDVVPTTVEDEYEIDLIMTFETNVPSPVVLIEMPKTLPALVGDETYSFNEP